MAARTETRRDDGGILETISRSVSLQVALLGFILLGIAFGLDSVFTQHIIPPLLAIWGSALIVLGIGVYGIIYLKTPN
jgi:predicted signal transduction protein with EAL and GGDEF domain